MSTSAPANPPTAAGPAAAAAPAPAPAAGSAAAPSTGTTAKPTKKASSSKAKPTKASSAGAGTTTKTKRPPRKKKPASKAASAASTQAVWNDAKAAQMDLAKQRAQATARRSDPLWYRVEDVLPTSSSEAVTAMAAASGILPEQIMVTETALARNGMTPADVTPQAMACLLEQARRFAQELIQDAQDYSYSANRQDLTRADLLLAAEMRADHPVAISTQLPKLNLVAQQVNRAPLPPIPMQCYSGILLPPKQHQLTARTYDIVSSAQVAQKMVQKAPEPPNKKNGSSTAAGAAGAGTPGYGASRGRQIPIKLKELPKAVVDSTSTTGPAPMDTSGSEPATTTSATTASATTGPAAPPPSSSTPVPMSGAAAQTATTTTGASAASADPTRPGLGPAPSGPKSGPMDTTGSGPAPLGPTSGAGPSPSGPVPASPSGLVSGTKSGAVPASPSGLASGPTSGAVPAPPSGLASGPISGPGPGPAPSGPASSPAPAPSGSGPASSTVPGPGPGSAPTQSPPK